jgi:hypothetical protein
MTLKTMNAPRRKQTRYLRRWSALAEKQKNSERYTALAMTAKQLVAYTGHRDEVVPDAIDDPQCATQEVEAVRVRGVPHDCLGPKEQQTATCIHMWKEERNTGISTYVVSNLASMELTTDGLPGVLTMEQRSPDWRCHKL